MAKLIWDELAPKDQRRLEGIFDSSLAVLEKERLLRPFLEHALTKSEHIMLARRIQIAKLLLQGWSGKRIERELKVGQRTVESVHTWLKDFPEYRRIIPKALSSRRGKVPHFEHPYTFAAIRRKYPLHFLLINLILGEE